MITSKEYMKLKRRVERLERKIKHYRFIFRQIVRWDDQRFANIILDNVGISQEDAKWENSLKW